MQNTGSKKTFCCNLPLDQKCVRFNLSFLKLKNTDVKQEAQLKIRKSKDKRKGFERDNKTGNQKRERIDEKHFELNILMLFFS